jgi:hypothetical protein
MIYAAVAAFGPPFSNRRREPQPAGIAKILRFKVKMASQRHKTNNNGQILTDAQLQRRKEIEIRRLKDAEAILVSVMPVMKGRMHRLCVLDIDPPADHVAEFSA